MRAWKRMVMASTTLFLCIVPAILWMPHPSEAEPLEQAKIQAKIAKKRLPSPPPPVDTPPSVTADVPAAAAPRPSAVMPGATVVCNLSEWVTAAQDSRLTLEDGTALMVSFNGGPYAFAWAETDGPGVLHVEGYAPQEVDWTLTEDGSAAICTPDPVPLEAPDTAVVVTVRFDAAVDLSAHPENESMGRVAVYGCNSRVHRTIDLANPPASLEVYLEVLPEPCTLYADVDRSVLVARTEDGAAWSRNVVGRSRPIAVNPVQGDDVSVVLQVRVAADAAVKKAVKAKVKPAIREGERDLLVLRDMLLDAGAHPDDVEVSIDGGKIRVTHQTPPDGPQRWSFRI
jgi:hypothetical protein